LEVFDWPIRVLSWADARIYWLWLNFNLAMRGYYYGDFPDHERSVAKAHYADIEKHLDERRSYIKWSVEDGC
jgi:hypothetical protein